MAINERLTLGYLGIMKVLRLNLSGTQVSHIVGIRSSSMSLSESSSFASFLEIFGV